MTNKDKEIRVPPTGDFKDVDVVDVLVKPGDTVKAEDPLLILETDKASMDIPATEAGTIKEVKIKVGDKVSEGSVIGTLEVDEASAEVPATKLSSEDEAILIVDSRRGPTLKGIIDLASPQTATIVIKAFLKIMSLWDVSDEDALVLLGSPRLSDLADWLTGKSSLPEEVLRRISHIMGIQTNLQALFEDQSRADGWVKRPNKAFGGKRALDRMLEGSEEDIAAVRRYLDAVVEGQG